MRTAMPALARRTDVPETARPAPVPAHDEAEADAIAARVIGGATLAGTAPPARAGGEGAALDPATRGLFEARLGMDLSAVRIRQDVAAARRQGARAFALGGQVVFGEGEYRPHHPEGQALLAHELAHVRQDALRGGAPVLRRKPCPGCHGDSGGSHRPTGTQDVTLEELDDSAAHYVAPDEGAQDAFAFIRNGMAWHTYKGCPRRRAQAIQWHGHDGSSQIIGYLLEFTNPKGSNFPRPLVTVDAQGKEVHATSIDPQAIESVMSPIDFIGPGLLAKPFVAGTRAVARGALRWGTRGVEALQSGGRKMVLSARLAGAGIYEGLPATAMEVGAAQSSLVMRSGAMAAPRTAMTAAEAEAFMGGTATRTTGIANAPVTGPSMADVGQQVGTQLPGTVAYGSTAAAATAALSSNLANASTPGFQTHSTAAGVRTSMGVSGATHQSVHVGPQVLYRALARQGYAVSPNRALTTNLPIDAHRAFDAGWVALWNTAVAQGRQITALMAYEWVKAAALAVDPALMTDPMKGILIDRLRTELFVELGLQPGTVIVPGRP
jgi:hypothetical protein